MVLLADGSVKGTGANGKGELGLGDTSNRDTFTAVTALGTDVVQITAGRAFVQDSNPRPCTRKNHPTYDGRSVSHVACFV